MELEIEKFSPTKAELVKLAEESKSLTLPDPFDQAQYARVKDAKKNLVTVRNTIAKTGKAFREEAIAFSKKVIEKEKELVKIIQPAEDRLETLLDEADHIIERQARVELLPHRRERLAAIKDGIVSSDDVLLEMDGPTFEGYINQRFADKNELDRIELATREANIREEETRQVREKEMREREEKARQEERERLERERKEQEEREAREKKEAEERAHKERERLEKEASYQTFLKEHGYDGPEDSHEFTIITDHLMGEVRLYKLVGVHKLK